MFTPFSKNEAPSAIDEKIAQLHSVLDGLDEFSDEYAAVVDQIVKFEKLKNDIKSPSWTPSPDAVLAAVATIGTTILVLHYEKLGAVTSKAFGFIGKMKN